MERLWHIFMYITTRELNEEVYTNTLCTSNWELLCSSSKCSPCKAHRADQGAIYNGWPKWSSDGSDTSSYTNDRYLNSPQKQVDILISKSQALKIIYLKHHVPRYMKLHKLSRIRNLMKSTKFEAHEN